MRKVTAALFAALLAAACSRNESTTTLALTLSPGMQRSMRITTEQRVESVPPGGTALSATSITMTWRFSVTAVSAGGIATLEASVVDAAVSAGSPLAAATVSALKGRRVTATMSPAGTILAMSAGGAAVTPVPGRPRAPSPDTDPRATADLGSLFGALNGRSVAVGETWTTPLPSSTGSGLQGTLSWTLASARGTTARVEYTGALAPQEMSLEGLPAGQASRVEGTSSGYVELERSTGWPLRGLSVVNARVTTGDGADRKVVGMKITTSFDEARAR
jgi:hypothetical protein